MAAMAFSYLYRCVCLVCVLKLNKVCVTLPLPLPSELVGAIIVVVIFAIFYELLKTVRELLMYFDLKRIQKNLVTHRRLNRSDSKEGLIMNDSTK